MSMMGWADRTINALTKCNVHESVIALNRPASYQVRITSMGARRRTPKAEGDRAAPSSAEKEMNFFSYCF
jgi:hypothetical protein